MSKPLLSFCAIVKNERINIERCLNSVKPYVDEMIVVDTGSDDATPEIALQHGAKVAHFNWCDDFSAARNYAISQASGEWILMLDADEELAVTSDDFKQTLAANTQFLVCSVELINIPSDGTKGGRLQRLFKNSPEIRYEGRLHESLVYRGQKIGGSLRGDLDSIKIWHYGYSNPELTLKKTTERNIPLLERMLQEEGLSLGNLYCLASMCERVGDAEKAQEYYAQLFESLLPYLIDGNQPEDFLWVPNILHFFGNKVLQQQDYETARTICQRGLEWFPNFPPLNYLAGEFLMNLGFPLGAIPYFETCIQLGRDGSYYKRAIFHVSYVTAYPAYQLGCAFFKLQRWQEAAAAFEMALSFDADLTPAKQSLEMAKQFLASQN